MGENHFLHRARLALGVGLLCAACAYWLLQRLLLKAEGPNCLLARAVGGDWKGNLSPLINAAAPRDLLRALHRGGGNLAPSRPADRGKDRAGGATAGRRSLTNISLGHGIFCNLACARPNR